MVITHPARSTTHVGASNVTVNVGGQIELVD
jgi:hypothetical protein